MTYQNLPLVKSMTCAISKTSPAEVLKFGMNKILIYVVVSVFNNVKVNDQGMGEIILRCRVNHEIARTKQRIPN